MNAKKRELVRNDDGAAPDNTEGCIYGLFALGFAIFVGFLLIVLLWGVLTGDIFESPYETSAPEEKQLYCDDRSTGERIALSNNDPSAWSGDELRRLGCEPHVWTYQ